jgi:C4-type Zn-finger protein
MREIINSEEKIKTGYFEKMTIIKTDPDSSSFIQLENFKDEKMINLKVEDEDNFKATIRFLQIDCLDQVVEKTCVIKRDDNGEISIFDGDKKIT